MVIYNLKTEYFTLAYNETEEGWVAIRSGRARLFKVKLWIEEQDGVPTGIRASLGHVMLNENNIESYIGVLQDASIFNDLLRKGGFEPIPRK